MLNTRTYTPYKQLPSIVTDLLTSQEKAAYIIEQYLKTRYLPKSSLATQMFRPQVSYVADHKLQFTRFDRFLYTNPGNVALWSGVINPTSTVNRQKETYKELGLIQIEDKDSLRIDIAKQLGLHMYAAITSKLTLFSPCAVAFLLLSSRTEEAKDFRSFIKDPYQPAKAYHSKRLFITLNKEIVNV